MQLPEIEFDGKLTRVDIGDLTIWYSYLTPIAFSVIGSELVIRENEWKQTTGKHLNSIDGGSAEAKSRRMSGEEFKRAFQNLEPITV